MAAGTAAMIGVIVTAVTLIACGAVCVYTMDRNAKIDAAERKAVEEERRIRENRRRAAAARGAAELAAAMPRQA